MLSGFYLHHNLTKCFADRMEETTNEKAFQARTCQITTLLELLPASKLHMCTFHTEFSHHYCSIRKNNFPVATIKQVFRTQQSQA